ncbi:MAG TPA: hypothetical protein VHL80_14780 [Polyangia bacterium]|nr:hypothetical protein [Polyangia bacterium]
MIESSPPRPRRVALAVLALLGCGELPPPPAATPVPAARTAPDDSDPWNLVPRGASSLADLDLVALRASPWSRSLVTGGFAEDREERQRVFGYDVFSDADRLVVVGADAVGASSQATVVVGRFDAGRVGAAFTAATPGAKAGRWRDCALWDGGGRAVALLPSGHTLVQGTPETVRAAIDAAWGLVPDARGGPRGELARELEAADSRRPTVTLALLVTDEMRARAAGFVEVPPELRRAAGRLDLGADLELAAEAVFDAPGPAAAAATRWSADLQELAQNRVLRLMGLGPLVDGATVTAAGARARGRLRIPEDKREALGERVLMLLQAVARQRGQAAPQP